MDDSKKVGTISTYLQRLEKITSRERKTLYFRGHSKASYRMVPSIFRNQGWIQNESTMLKELILRCPNDFSDRMSTFECLVKMQHYALPTRLLDITSNSLVALYFACFTHEKDDEDGEVIVTGFDTDQIKYFDSDTVNVLSNLSRREASFLAPEGEDIDEFNKDASIKLLLHDIRKDRPHFDPKILPSDIRSVVCVKPRLDNPRIIRQDGAFLLFGIGQDKTRPASMPSSAVIDRIVINRDKKTEISMQLETLGISKAALFPEIEQVATHIRDQYAVPKLDKSKLNEVQWRVFEAMKNSGIRSIKEISIALGATPSSVSSAISRLLEMGVIERHGSGREVAWAAKNVVELI